MELIEVIPVQWTSLKDIEDVEPLNDKDASCLAEIRDVLMRHGMLDRFGIALLHSHFELGEDEVLLETTDKAGKSLVTSPAQLKEALSDAIGTVWKLSEDASTTMAYCKRYCRRWGLVGHDTGHDRRK